MPEGQREIVITRIALLELRDEQRLAKEGYDLLDEKRILLAAAIRRALAQLETLQSECRQAERAAVEAFKAALGRHGFDELSVYPPPLLPTGDRLELARSRLLGLELVAARWREGTRSHEVQPPYAAPEARVCALAYRRQLAALTQLAACIVTIRRLAREFTRTERRARAIENILLPEIEDLVRLVTEQLEQLDQEEIARLHRRRAVLAEHANESPTVWP